MWLYLVVFFVSLLILHLIVTTRQDTREPFTEQPPPLDMDMVMDKYCKSRVALDRDEYMGPWDDTAVPFCAMSKCPDEECKIVKLNAARSGYVWETNTMTKKKEFNDELQREECVSNTNGTTVMCGDDADTVVTSCPNLKQTCHKFDPVHKVYHSTEYNWFLNSSGSCAYRPVGNFSGEVITSPSDPTQCRQTPPPILDDHVCSDGTTLMQEYNASGDPVYLNSDGDEIPTHQIDDECDRCPVSTSGCQYFNRSGSSPRGGDWGCAKLKRMYGPPGSADIADCVVRFDSVGGAIHGIPYDDSDSDPGRCVEQCCSIGSACGARLDYYNIDNRADIERASNADGTVTCGRYEQDEVYNAVLNKVENDYIPRYKFGRMSPSDHAELGADFNDHPTGIELVQSTRCTGAGCDIIDITGYTIPEVCDTSCPAGSKRVGAGVPKCSMCDLNTHYYNGGGCVVHDGCTDINTKFVPNNLDRTQNDFGLFYNTTNNTDISGNPACVPCETNTYLPARPTSQYQTMDALRQTCISCDAGNEYYDFASNVCTVCGSDAKLYTKPDGWRDCSNCPDPGANGFVTYDEVIEGGKCVKSCAENYFGGGVYRSSTYPVCVENCGLNQKYDPSAEECVTCPGGSEMLDSSHSNTSCDPCQIGFFRGDDAGFESRCEACPVYSYTDIEGNNQTLAGRTDMRGSRTNTDCYVNCIGDPGNKAYYSAQTLRYDASTCGNRSTECESSTEYVTEVVAEAGQDLATGAIVSRVVPNVYDSMGSSGCVKNGAPDIEWSVVSTERASHTDLMLHTVPQASGVDMKVVCPNNTTLYDTDNCMCSNDPGTDEANGYVVEREGGVNRSHPFDSLDYRCVFECLPADSAVPHVWMADDNDATSRTCVKACKDGTYASKNGALAPGDACTGCPIANSEVSLTAATTENSNYFMGSSADMNIKATTRTPSISGSANGVANCQVGITGAKAVTANDLCGTPPTGMQWEIGAANGGSTPNNMNYVDTANFKAYDRSNCMVNCGSVYQIAGHTGESAYRITPVFNYDSELSGHIVPRLIHYLAPKKTFHQFNSDNKPVVSSAKGVHENSYLPFGSTCPVDDSGALTGGAMRQQDGTMMTDDMGLYTNRAAATDRDSSAFFASVNSDPIYWCKDGHTLSHPDPGVTGPSVCCEGGTTAVWADDDSGDVRCVDDTVVYLRDGAVGENSEPTVFKPVLFTPPVGKDQHTAPVAELTDEDVSSTTKEAHTAAVITYEGTGTKNPDYVYGIDYSDVMGTIATDGSGTSGWKRVSRLFLGTSAGNNTLGDMFVCETKNAPGASVEGPYTRPVFNDKDEVACCEYYEYATPVEGEEVPSERLQFTESSDGRTKICHRPDCDPRRGCRSIMVDSLMHQTYRAAVGGASRYLISAKEHDLSTHRGAMTADYVLKPVYTDHAGATQVAQLTADSAVDSSFISAGSGPIMLRLTVKSYGIGVGWALQYKELGEEDTMGTPPGWMDVRGSANCKVYEYAEPSDYSRTWLVSHENVGWDDLRTIIPGVFNSDSKVFVVLGNPGAASTNFRILTVNSCTASSIVVKFAELNSSDYNISQNKLELTNRSTNQMVMGMQVMDAPQRTCTDASSTIDDMYGTSSRLMNDVGYFLYERECVVKCHQTDEAGSTVYGVMLTDGDVTCPSYQDQAITYIPTNWNNSVDIRDQSHDLYGTPVGYAAICEQRETRLEDYVQAGSTPEQCDGFETYGIDTMFNMNKPMGVQERKYKCLDNTVPIRIEDFEASNVESLDNKTAISNASASYFDNKICASNCPPAYQMVVTADADMTSTQHASADGGATQLGHKSATLTRKMYYTATGSCDTMNSLTDLIDSFDGTAVNEGVYIDLNATPVDDTTGQFHTSDGVYADTATRHVCTGEGHIVRNPEGGVGCCANANDSLWIDPTGISHCCANGLRYVETDTGGICLQMAGCSETAVIFVDADNFAGISPATSQRCYEQLTGTDADGDLNSYIAANWVSVGDATFRRPFVLERAGTGGDKYWINTLRDPTGFEFATYERDLGKTFAYMEWIQTSSENFVKLVTNGYSVDMYLYKNSTNSDVLPMLKVISVGTGQEFRGYIHHDMMDRGDISNGNVVNSMTVIGTNYIQAVNLVGMANGGGDEMVLSATAQRVDVQGLCKDVYRPNTRPGDLDSPVPSDLLAYDVTLASDLEVKLGDRECTYRCPSECGDGSGEFVYDPTRTAAELVDGNCGDKSCQSCSIDIESGVIGTCCQDLSCSLSSCVPCGVGMTECPPLR